VPVHEVFRGETAWKGTVEVFDLSGHRKAKRCYAWQYEDGTETKTVAVLEIPPVDSPESAVKVAIAAKARSSRQDSANRLAHEESNCSPQEIPKRADKSQVERIRKEIHERGECIIKRAELPTLWIRELSADSELNAIWALSVAEHWSFTISPNGDVRFASLVSN